jgi:hypothetical protein
LTSLAQILLDPYYRTLEGFAYLVEKEWLAFGHPFLNRNGFCADKKEEESPIFTQWLDCIHQLTLQFPDVFEFNLDLINFLAFHVYSCKYGTFLFNTDKERKANDVAGSTVSIWTDIFRNKEQFTNYYYIKEKKELQKLIAPSHALFKIKLWEEFYLKSNETIKSNKQNKFEQLNGEGNFFFI